MLKFRQTTLKIKDIETKGYAVEGLDDAVFRGLQVAVVKNGNNGWLALEATTGIGLTPPSWAGVYSNKTREGIIQIVANSLLNAPESLWARIQQELDYDLGAEAFLLDN